MSELAFAELQTQIESLPFYQVILLKNKIDRMVEKEKERESESFVNEGLAWLDSIAGSVHREIDYKKELESCRDVIDTNIILDTVQQREPFCSDAKKILECCIRNKRF